MGEPSVSPELEGLACGFGFQWCDRRMTDGLRNAVAELLVNSGEDRDYDTTRKSVLNHWP